MWPLSFLDLKTFMKHVFFFNYFQFSQVLHPYMSNIAQWFVQTNFKVVNIIFKVHNMMGVQQTLLLLTSQRVYMFLVCLLQAMKYFIGTWPTSFSWIAYFLFTHLFYMMMMHCLYSIKMIQKFVDRSMHTLWPTTSKFSQNGLSIILC